MPAPRPISSPVQLVLLPRVLELPGFHGAEGAARREELERYRCLEAFRMAPPSPLAQACARLVCSVSALLHGGALCEWGCCGWRDGTGSGDVMGAAGWVEPAWWVMMGLCPWQGAGRVRAGQPRLHAGSAARSLPVRPTGLPQQRVSGAGRAVPVQAPRHRPPLQPLCPRQLWLWAPGLQL